MENLPLGQHVETFSTSSDPISTPRTTQSTDFDTNPAPNPTNGTVRRFPTPPLRRNTSVPDVNPRSCTTCRRRKVRCDKRYPCSNCQKAGNECVFPGPGRAPRRSRKTPETELLARLRRLEGLVQSLGKDANGEQLLLGEENIASGAGEATERQDDRLKTQDREAAENDWRGRKCPTTAPDMTDVEKEIGRLVVDDGRSWYVSNTFWTRLTQEVEEMQDILDDPSDDDTDYPSPESSSPDSVAQQGFIFGFSSTAVTLRDLHPPREKLSIFWDVYKDRIDPLVRLFHRGYTWKLLVEASQNLDQVCKPTEALMFAIYFAVVTSLAPAECRSILSEDKDVAVKKYRFGIEQALARAEFLTTQELLVLQAFTLFLICARRHYDTRFVWTITGLVVRIAQSMGVHRDGKQFGLTPYETELRRRVWWQIIVLDNRASEDQGTDPTITEEMFDTRMPLNINDDDINPDTKETPEERLGCTEMTFDLIRYEISVCARRLTYVPHGMGMCRYKSLASSLEGKERVVEELRVLLESKYLKHCDMSVPLYWVTATVSRLVLAKMWLIVHHPFKREDRGAGLSQEIKDKLFLTSIEIIEYHQLLEHEQTTVKWGWLFHSYIQYHSIAYLLSELCTRTKGSAVDRAWVAIDQVFERERELLPAHNKAMLWKPLRKFMLKAKAVRLRELELSPSFPQDGSLGPLSLPTNLPQTANDISGTTGFDSSNYNGATPKENAPFNGKQPLLGTEQPLYDTEGMNEWMRDSPTLLQDPLNGGEVMDWAGWDDLVKGYQLEAQQDQGQGQGIESGPLIASMTGWW